LLYLSIRRYTEWTTGSNSGGNTVTGLGGHPAQVITNVDIKFSGTTRLWNSLHLVGSKSKDWTTGARNFLCTYLFSIKFLYFFIISSLFPYFNIRLYEY